MLWVSTYGRLVSASGPFRFAGIKVHWGWYYRRRLKASQLHVAVSGLAFGRGKIYCSLIMIRYYELEKENALFAGVILVIKIGCQSSSCHKC